MDSSTESSDDEWALHRSAYHSTRDADRGTISRDLWGSLEEESDEDDGLQLAQSAHDPFDGSESDSDSGSSDDLQLAQDDTNDIMEDIECESATRLGYKEEYERDNQVNRQDSSAPSEGSETEIEDDASVKDEIASNPASPKKSGLGERVQDESKPEKMNDVPEGYCEAGGAGIDDTVEPRIAGNNFPSSQLSRAEWQEAQRLFMNLERSFVSTTEISAMSVGYQLTGPPIGQPITQTDQWKRKFRWPVQLRNVRRKRFAGNEAVIAKDHDLSLYNNESNTTAESESLAKKTSRAFDAALAPSVRPLLNIAATSIRQATRKRPRDPAADSTMQDTSAPPTTTTTSQEQLRSISRLSGHFTDELLDSILKMNANALQGLDVSYTQQSWTPLPTTKKPIANWRFVLEHICTTTAHASHAPRDELCSKLRKRSLIRIRDRLKTIYGLPWRDEDDEFFFGLINRQTDDDDTEHTEGDLIEL